MDNNILIKNYAAYIERLRKYVGETYPDSLVKILGGDEKIMSATFYNMEKSGLAYDGSMVVAVFDIIRFALGINNLMPDENKVDTNSIIKVGLLQHIAKVNMFEEAETWQKKNGTMYKYRQQEGALRCGERSILLATTVGITFTAAEFEAMRVIDKDAVTDDYSNYFSTPLAIIIRQANELVSLKYRNNG